MHHIFSNYDSFFFLESLIWDVNFGWFLKYFHALGASIIFFFIYSHIIWAILYKLFYNPRHFIWYSGIFLFLFFIVTSFLGYALPWGQMSYWGVTVICSLLTSIPVFGNYLVELCWGSFVINVVTLWRFFTFHFFLPFVVFNIILFHLYELHRLGSSSPFSFVDNFNYSWMDLVKYYSFKDIWIYIFLFIFFFYILSFFQDFF